MTSEQITRTRVLTVAGTYIPSTSGGGHIRSLAAMIDQLRGDLEFFVVCRDRDPGQSRPYDQVMVQTWLDVGSARVWYEPRGRFTGRRYRHWFTSVQPAVLYLNTLYSWREAVLPALVARSTAPSIHVIIATRGSLDPNALALKRIKKRLLLSLLRALRFDRSVTFQASNERERHQIRAVFPHAEAVVTGHLAQPAQVAEPRARPKRPGSARLLVVGRVVPIKNTAFLLHRLKAVTGEVTVTVAGPIEDRDYWSECQRAAQDLPHVAIDFLGYVAHTDIPDLMAGHDFLVHPSLGENFCHAVAEALAYGLPVLASDRTPWRGLISYSAGWDFDLNDERRWTETLQQIVEMDEAKLRRYREGAQVAFTALADIEENRQRHLRLFVRSGRSC